MPHDAPGHRSGRLQPAVNNMRIAIASWSRRKVGGVEQYLSIVLPELVSAGHTVSLLYEREGPANRESISLPDGVNSWAVESLGTFRATEALRDWRPDLIYEHGLQDPAL